jgi:hypothetical protein
MSARLLFINFVNYARMRYYLRSLGLNSRKAMANIQFPQLAGEFILPEQLSDLIRDELFSSVFRISFGQCPDLDTLRRNLEPR